MGVTLDDVVAISFALPGTSEVLVWEGVRTFRVRNKIFVMGSPGSPTILVKTSREEQAELLATDPETFTLAPYAGRFGWTQVRMSTVDADELGELIIEAWRRTAPKAAVKAYDGQLS